MTPSKPKTLIEKNHRGLPTADKYAVLATDAAQIQKELELAFGSRALAPLANTAQKLFLG